MSDTILRRYADIVTRNEETEAEGESDGLLRFTAVLSTDAPVEMGYDMVEVLEHSEAAIDTTRLENGVVLFNHDYSTAIGKVEGYEIADGELRVDVAIGASAKADEVAGQIRAGILNKMSVGYRFTADDLDHMESDGKSIYTVRRWRVIESSVTPVPADWGATIGDTREHYRSLTCTNPNPQSTDKGGDSRSDTSTNEETANMSTPEVNIQEQIAKAKADEKARQSAIRAVCRDFEIDGETEQRFIDDETEISEVREAVLNIEKERKAAAAVEAAKAKAKAEASEGDQTRTVDSTPDAPAVHTRKHVYSIARALDTPLHKLDGLESEMHDKLLEQRDESRRSVEGILIPGEAIGMAAYSHLRKNLPADKRANMDKEFGYGQRVISGAAGSGSALNADELLPGMFVDVLRNFGKLGDLGVTTLDGLDSDVNLPRQSGATGFSWISNTSNSANADTTDATFDDISITMHTAVAKTSIGRKALMNSRPEITNLWMADVVVGAAETLTDALINGTGASNQPTGVLNVTGRQAQTGANAGALTWAQIGQVCAKIYNSNVGNQSMGAKFLFNGTDYAALETRPRDAGSGLMILENKSINTIPALYWNGVPANVAVAGFFDQAIVATYGSGIEFRPLVTQGISGRQFEMYLDCDIQVRHPTAFIKISNA